MIYQDRENAPAASASTAGGAATTTFATDVAAARVANAGILAIVAVPNPAPKQPV